MTAQLWLPARRHLAALAETAPALRHWISRGTHLADALPGLLPLLEDVFANLPKPLPIAPWTRRSDAPEDCAGRWLRADPCHLRVETAGVRMLACGVMQLSMPEAEAYARSLQPLFDEAGWRLHVATPERWYLQPTPEYESIGGGAPEDVVGAYIDTALPVGDGGRASRVWLNEIQMALHEHPTSRERRARGLPEVNSLWLHGDGVCAAAPRCLATSVHSHDPLLHALATASGVRAAAAADQTFSGALIDARSWDAMLLSMIAALHAANAAVELKLESGERFRYRPWHRLRFWRREP